MIKKLLFFFSCLLLLIPLLAIGQDIRNLNKKEISSLYISSTKSRDSLQLILNENLFKQQTLENNLAEKDKILIKSQVSLNENLRVARLFQDSIRTLKEELASSQAIVSNQKDVAFSNQNSRIVRINYLNSVNGYRINILWKPNKEKQSGSSEWIVGPAILEFTDDQTNEVYQLVNSHFGLSPEKYNHSLKIEDDGKVVILKDSILLSYHNIEPIDKQGGFMYEEPFFFLDLNFDNKKELLLQETENGQRRENNYRVFNLGVSHNLLELTFSQPYCSLDGYSIFDRTNKKIHIIGSNGACAGTEDIYKFTTQTVIDKTYNIQFEVSDYQLDIQKVHEPDSNFKCKEYMYQIIKPNRKLVSVRSIQ